MRYYVGNFEKSIEKNRYKMGVDRLSSLYSLTW